MFLKLFFVEYSFSVLGEERQYVLSEDSRIRRFVLMTI